MGQHHSDLAAALAAAAETINAPQDLEQTLDAIVHATRASVPGFDHVGISVRHGDGTYETKAATSQLVLDLDLDLLQYRLAEGPCVDAMENDEVVVGVSLSMEQRWPRYAPGAAAAGVRSQLGVGLFTEETALGGLNFYSTVSDTIHPEAELGAELFATHAAQALGHARRELQLNEAMGTRTVIGEAIGLLMERYGIDEQRAFQFLVRASSTSNTKLREVARQLVDEAETKYSPHRT